ncbi:penicillin-binding protein 2 [Clostridium sp. CAG:575]|nr:penicillin-binding protein 2 [Clostridium sp. CAG:575]
MKDKKIIIGTIVIIVVIIAILLTAIFIKNKDTEKPEDVLSAYVALINEQKYDEMYSKISEESKTKISQEDFTKRNKNIYEGIDAYDIKITVSETKKENGIYKIAYDESMSTAAGTINFTNTAKIVKENKEYKIDWSSSMIFPQLRNNDKVRISSIESKRGEILDRNDNKLAANGTILTVGIVPGKLGDKEGNISKISELTGVSTEYINSQLSASYVKDDTFVPIKKISASNENLKNQLLQISGVMINTTESRVYTLGEEAAHLIGYVQKVNADDLKEQEGKGYNANSLIGKSGLEKTYEDTLRGIDGKEIYITDENGNRLTTLAKQEKQDGRDVKLTIDSDIQKQLYEQLKDDKGFFVVMNPETGELLATVSTPSYDSNDFVLGLTNDEWNALNNDENKPLYNRFLQSYCPGSTFKPITAAIGLSSGKLTTDTTFNYSGLKWQKSSSWGDIYITTLTAYSGAKNIRNALIHSDNIFFAQAAMQIGSTTFCEELKKLGFNESINEQIKFPLTIKKSQYSNSDKIDNEKKLADSGYGQGDVLVNPIHMASIYSAFANNGNMIKPYIEYRENAEAEILKESVFSAEIANTIKDDLIQVVENPEGTAKDMKTAGVTIAGKTGTAELKTSQNDTEGGLLGWFDCFTVNNPSGNDMLIISMVENTQNNGNGGSHYLIKKIKTLF